MAEIRINATGGVKLYDADDSHYAQILAGTITANTDVMTLGHAAVVMGTKLDLNGNNLILDADADTYLDGGTVDDVVDVYVAGAKDWKFGANSINVLSGTTLTIDSGATITNSGTATGFGGADPASADGDTLGTASAEWSDLYLADGGVIYFGNDQEITLTHAADDGLLLKHVGTGDGKEPSLTFQAGDNDIAADDVLGSIFFQAPDEGAGTDAIEVAAGIEAVAEGDFSSSSNATSLVFKTGASEAATSKVAISSTGVLSVGETTSATNTNIKILMDQVGHDLAVGMWAGQMADGVSTASVNDPNAFIAYLSNYGIFTAVRSAGNCMDLNRVASDGDIAVFRQAATSEGTISVSGSTVSYNAFCGSHWSRLADNSKPTILRGTVMESIAAMMDWYQAEFVPAGKEDHPDNYCKQSIALPEGKSVGDTFQYDTDPPPGGNSQTVTATIIKEDNERLPKCKISDTEDSKAVYGVFMGWDDEDDGNDGDVNDMYVAAIGAFVVRMHKDETVAIGDYLQSKGDGTAKVQADDILRASTIAKVTSTEKTHTHADDSYCVPCTLHCG